MKNISKLLNYILVVLYGISIILNVFTIRNLIKAKKENR